MRIPLAILALGGALAAQAAGPVVWFCPLDPIQRPEVGYGGSPQYMGLFAPDAPWRKSAARVRVFKIYPQWITNANDADLKRQFADLKRRRIALALEYGVMSTNGTCGMGVEGYGGQHLLQAAQRIDQDGGTLAYVAMDEPIFFGSVYSGHNACHGTPAQAVAAAAPNLKALLAAYPNVKVGDIEPLGNTQLVTTIESYRQGIEAFHAALGIPLAFFDADIDWKPAEPSLDGLATLQKMVAAEHLPFGIIYDGNPDASTSAAWISAAQAHMAEAEAAAGTPDIAIFQSWHSQPRKLLPETDPDSFTHLIDSYFRIRTKLTTSIFASAMFGNLKTAQGTPIANAPINIEIRRRATTGEMETFSITGIVPPGATKVCFGVRGNEGSFSGPADLRIKEFRLETKSGWTAACSARNPAGMNGWASAAKADAAGQSDTLRVTAPQGQHVELNSAGTPTPSAGEPFTFSVQASVTPESDGSGYFSVFFLNEKRELSRTLILFQPQAQSVGTTTTGKAGTWTMVLPIHGGYDFTVEARYPGDETYWPAQGRVTEGRLSPGAQ